MGRELGLWLVLGVGKVGFFFAWGIEGEKGVLCEDVVYLFFFVEVFFVVVGDVDVFGVEYV